MASMSWRRWTGGTSRRFDRVMQPFETGRHDELVNRGGLYQRLYELQFVTSDVNPE